MQHTIILGFVFAAWMAVNAALLVMLYKASRRPLISSGAIMTDDNIETAVLTAGATAQADVAIIKTDAEVALDKAKALGSGLNAHIQTLGASTWLTNAETFVTKAIAEIEAHFKAFV